MLDTDHPMRSMTMDEQADNPYASPNTLPSAGRGVALSGRIEFSGVVERSQLRQSLRTRLSWSGIGTFAVISLICFTSSPGSLLLPWTPRGLAGNAGAMGELVGIVGLGFLLLSVWHLLLTCTHWGVDRRERAILQSSPRLYDVPTCGYLDTDHLFLDQPSGKVWLAWAAMGVCQFADELLLIQWTKGVVGCTVLTRNMFSAADQFSHATYVFESQMRAPYVERKQSRAMYLEVEATERLRSDANWLARAEQRGHPGSVIGTLVGIPTAIIRFSGPLHVFFGILVVFALLMTRQKWQVVSTLFAVWAGILLVASLISIVQNRELFSMRTSFAARRTLYPHEIHLDTAYAYFVVPNDQFQLVGADDQHMTIRQKEYSLSVRFQRSDFRSDDAFQRASSIFAEG